MQTNPDIIVGNLIASIDLEPDNYWSDNIGVALVSYFENHSDCPEDSPTDDERGGWKVWALDKADNVIERIGQVINEMMKSS